jgi:hypothetical protein
MVRVEFGKARCRFHRGLSTGPKTEAGRGRIAEAQRRRWRLYREMRQGISLARRERARLGLRDTYGGSEAKKR